MIVTDDKSKNYIYNGKESYDALETLDFSPPSKQDKKDLSNMFGKIIDANKTATSQGKGGKIKKLE